MASSTRRPELDAIEALARAADHMLEGLQIVDRDWRYVYVNQTAARHGRRSREELLGRTMMECYPGIEDTPMFEHLRSAADQGRRQLLENEFRYPDGSLGWFELRIEPSDVGVVILSLDISRRKRAEAEVQRHLLRLEQSNRDLEHFAHVAAHDLRAPLRQIASYIELLREDSGAGRDLGSPEASSHLTAIESAAGRMQELLQELLRYSTLRTDVGPVGPVELDEVLNGVLVTLEERIHASRARIERAPLPRVLSTPTLMRRLLENLLENALKYRRPGTDAVVRISAREVDGAWTVTIEDEGIGFPPRAEQRMFRLFSRLHAAEDAAEPPGAGLGLAICHRIVDLHGGSIRAEASPSGGARLIFSLPAEERP